MPRRDQPDCCTTAPFHEAVQRRQSRDPRSCITPPSGADFHHSVEWPSAAPTLAAQQAVLLAYLQLCFHQFARAGKRQLGRKLLYVKTPPAQVSSASQCLAPHHERTFPPECFRTD